MSGFSEVEHDRCHEATECDHRCVVCDPEERRRQISELTRRRDVLADLIESYGTQMPAEKHFAYYDELEDILRRLRKLES